MAARNIKSEVPDAEVIIVDQKEYFEYTPGILRALVDPSHLPLLHARMRDIVCSPSLLQQIVGWWPTPGAVNSLWPETPAVTSCPSGSHVQGLSFLWGAVQSVDTQQRAVVVSPLQCRPTSNLHQVAAQPVQIPYDYLILATGSDYAAPMKPSALELTHAARCEGVSAIHQRLAALHKQGGEVLVIGGGAVGVEMVGELAVRFPALKVTLVSSSARLLADQTAAVSTAALQWCEQHGVRVLLGTRANRAVDAPAKSENATSAPARARSQSRKAPAPSSGASLAAAPSDTATGSKPHSASAHVLHETRGGLFVLQSGEELHVDMSFTCVGFKPNSAVFSDPACGLAQCLTPSGQLEVNDRLQVVLPADSASARRVYCAGDVSLHRATAELKLAHTAEMMAHTVAANVSGHMESDAYAGLWAQCLASVMAVVFLCLRVLGVAGSSGTPHAAAAHEYPGHITGSKGWPIPRVMCVSLGPHEAILIMNGMSLTSYPGRVAGAWAKWVIETSKMWATRDLAIGHGIWAFGDAAAVTVSNLLVFPLGSNQPPSLVHRVATGTAAAETTAPVRMLWSAWLHAITLLSTGLCWALPGVFTPVAFKDAAGGLQQQMTASL